ncbi:NHLP bacteriocin system secretion protein [Sphingorhabdus sp. Alg231-15]|uniref:NHLP bacteriocin system secretion protein n=1 Tax=Sphingorhabdus sp. Alg231-15 TaxID=1922222 RepID=UPI000D54D804
MARQIFRQEAIDRMASPDRLDQPLRLVKPTNWLFLIVTAVIILFAVIWGFVASVPIKVNAQGIMIDSAGLSEVAVQYQGRVDAILVEPGEKVQKGDVIARLTRDNRERDIRIAEAALRDARMKAGVAESVFRRGEGRLGGAEARQLASVNARMAELRRQLVTREETANNLRGLVEQNAATREELMNVIALNDSIRADMRKLEQERLQVGVAAAQRRNGRDQSRLADNQLIQERRRELEKLRAQTDDEILIRAPQSGRLLELKVNPGDVLAPGEAIATIDARTNRAAEKGGFDAVLFVPPDGGKRIDPGMVVELVPTTTAKEVYGHIKGEVITAGALPASREAMRRYLQNDQLVEQLSATAPPIEVKVRLERTNNPSGFRWSSSSGPERPVTKGTMLAGKIVVEQKAMIDVVLPGVRNRISHSLSGAE